VLAVASGWMSVKQRARQAGVELPLVISDHVDWNELRQTITECGAQKVWVTHGREDALVYWCRQQGLESEPLNLVAYEEDGGEGAGDSAGEAA
jgi:putative mRNA 3-end processing factor